MSDDLTWLTARLRGPDGGQVLRGRGPDGGQVLRGRGVILGPGSPGPGAGGRLAVTDGQRLENLDTQNKIQKYREYGIRNTVEHKKSN